MLMVAAILAFGVCLFTLDSMTPMRTTLAIALHDGINTMAANNIATGKLYYTALENVGLLNSK